MLLFRPQLEGLFLSSLLLQLLKLLLLKQLVMLLLVVFRPNLENRVAMLMLSPEWFPRRRAA